MLLRKKLRKLNVQKFFDSGKIEHLLIVDNYSQVAEIARIDHPGSYENSGTVCYFYDGKFWITDFSHCSCYGTFGRDGCQGGGWSGTLQELYDLVRNEFDCSMTKRKIVEEDDNYLDMEVLYNGIADWFNKFIKKD